MMIEELQEQGWQYRDLPKMTEELMKEFRSIVGEENLKFLTFAQYCNADGSNKSVRGQIMISQKGIERLALYKEEYDAKYKQG